MSQAATETAKLTTKRIHEAAREAVLELGLSRTTLADVARRAGVSRMSIYRRYADVEELLREILTTEFTEVVRQAVARAEGDHGRARVVGQAAEIATDIRANVIWQKIVRDEPGLLMPYVFERFGATQQALLEAIEHSIRQGQADGSVREGDPQVLAVAVQLVAQSFTNSAGIHDELSAEHVMVQLPIILERYLRPTA